MAVDNPAGLISTAAIQSQARSYLFYSRPNGELAYLESQTERETSSTDPNGSKYKTGNIMVNNMIVQANTESPQIAVAAFYFNGHSEIRVYYISRNGFLEELARTDGGPWSRGFLNDSEIKASPLSLLTASVDAKGELKVYYNADGDPGMRCAWFVLGGKSGWSKHKISDNN